MAEEKKKKKETGKPKGEAAPKKAAWFAVGDKGWKQAQQEDAAAKERRAKMYGPGRFRLKYDTSGKVVWLDTPSFFLHEHYVKTQRSKFPIPLTCIREMDNCPPCDGDDHPSYVVVGTIISLNKWTDKNGKIHKNDKQLFVAKATARQKLMKQIERRKGDLTLCLYEIARGSQQQSPATGDDFEFIKKVSLESVKKLAPEKDAEGKAIDPDEWVKPYDYAEILAPLTAKEIRQLMGSSEVPVGADEELDDEDDDTDDPFDDDEEEEPKSKKKKKAAPEPEKKAKKKKKPAPEPEEDDDLDDDDEEADEEDDEYEGLDDFV